MLQRCTNPKNGKWHLYGGAGVSVCERWRSFESFLSDMGERPSKQSLDRIDPDKGYEPGNCRWATIKEQNRNLRTATKVEWNGEIVALTQLAEEHGKHINTVKLRLSRGLSLREALQ